MMKMFAVISVLGASLAAITSCSQSQPDEARRPGPPPRGPIWELLDTDENGEISMKEIDAAAAILKKRDSNGDGVLTADELPRPPRPEDSPNRRREDRDQNQLPRPGEPDRDHQRPALETESDRVAPDGSVQLRGGYETDRRDGGRPVVLIAAALGVQPQVFRDAFSNVNPSRGGAPSPALARRNKEVLMSALGKHGISNDRLDEVSNYYRYRPESGQRWRHREANVSAVIEAGQVTGFRIHDGGAGYSSVPTITVPGHKVHVKVELEYSKDLKTNGRIRSLTIVEHP